MACHTIAVKLIKLFIVLLIAYWALAHTLPIHNFFVANWDDGNSHYAYIAWSRGLVPNIDFIHGYPGLSSWLQLNLYELTGLNLSYQKGILFFFGYLNALLLAFFFSRILGFMGGVLGFVFGIWISILHWPVINPGFLAHAIISLGLGIGWLHLERKSIFSSSVWLVVASALIGGSFGFKQNALFPILGFIAFLVWSLDRNIVTKKILWFIFTLFIFVPLLGFLTLRIIPGFKMHPAASIAVGPWIILTIAIFLDLLRAAPQVFKISVSLFWQCLVSCGTASIAWLLIYPAPIQNAYYILSEILWNVPKLIDRYYVPLPLTSLVAILSVLILTITTVVTLVYFARENKKISMPLGLFLMFLIIVATYFLATPTTSFKDSILLFSPANWDFYVVPSIIGIIAGFILCSSTIWDKVSAPWKLLIITSFVTVASLFPYYGNYRYCSLALFIIFLSPLILTASNPPQREWLAIRTFLLITMALTTVLAANQRFEGIMAIPEKEFPNLGVNVRVTEKNEIFLRVANELAPSLTPSSTVGGYPESATLCAFTVAQCFGKSPNFIGDQDDFNRLTNLISENKGPEYFLTSRDNFPYEAGFEYFPEPSLLIEALNKNYTIDKVYPFGSRELLLFRKNGVGL
ncbi:MAG: hypothetical protein SGJ02_03550 [bacterium]|nr:hypothetical protein [bacterium]